jgi:hypothetical protein
VNFHVFRFGGTGGGLETETLYKKNGKIGKNDIVISFQQDMMTGNMSSSFVLTKSMFYNLHQGKKFLFMQLSEIIQFEFLYWSVSVTQIVLQLY